MNSRCTQSELCKSGKRKHRLSADRSHALSTYLRSRAGWVKVSQLVISYPVYDRGKSNCIPCLGQRGQKNHTLSSGTSPYSPNKGVPPPRPAPHRDILNILVWNRIAWHWVIRLQGSIFLASTVVSACVLKTKSFVCTHSNEGLTLETSASESLYGGQFTLSMQLIKPNYLVILPTDTAPQFH